MKEYNVFNIKWWLIDPDTGLASARKLRMFVWVFMIPVIIGGVLAGDISAVNSLALLGIAFGDGVSYAIKPPKGKTVPKAQ